jgi:hypothetical protein
VILGLSRFYSDEECTLGLLNVNGKFFCFTLEDAFHQVKVPGKTRIPDGDFLIGWQKAITPLTEKYRARYPDFFKWHLEVKAVPDFTGVYVHTGNVPAHTEGCLLVGDTCTRGYIGSSLTAFKRLYSCVGTVLDKGEPCHISIRSSGEGLGVSPCR